jgi:hypothetical protein
MILKMLEEPIVTISSWTLAWRVFNEDNQSGWSPTAAQRNSVTRAMRDFCRKSNQFQLAGGKGRMNLYMFDAADPVSVKWAQMATGEAPYQRPKLERASYGKRSRRIYGPPTCAAQDAVAKEDPIYAAKLREQRRDELTVKAAKAGVFISPDNKLFDDGE